MLPRQHVRSAALAVVVALLLALLMLLAPTTPVSAQLVAAPVAHFGFDNDFTDDLSNYSYSSTSSVSIDSSQVEWGWGSANFPSGSTGANFAQPLAFVGQPGQYVSAWALSAWVYVTDISVLNPILTYWPDSDNEFFSWGLQPTAFGFSPVLNITMCQDAGGSQCSVRQVTAYNTSGVPANTWTHVAVAAIPQLGGSVPQFVMWQNGVETGQYSDRAGFVYLPQAITGTSWAFGYQGEYGAAFQGNMDELWVFSSPPSDPSLSFPLQYFNDPHAQVLAANNTMPCSPGQYLSDETLMVCSTVGAGKYSPTYGQLAATPCPLNVVSNVGSSSPDHCNQTCPAGGGGGLPVCCSYGVSPRGEIVRDIELASASLAGGLFCAMHAIYEYKKNSADTLARLWSAAVNVGCTGIKVTEWANAAVSLIESCEALTDYDSHATQIDLQQRYCNSASDVLAAIAANSSTVRLLGLSDDEAQLVLSTAQQAQSYML